MFQTILKWRDVPVSCRPLHLKRWSHFVWCAQLIDKHSRALPIDLGSDRVGTFSTSIHLTCLLLFPNVKPKSKQPKQLEINRKLLIKCFWGNDKTALWTYRFACVAQYLPSKFLESRAGERQFAPVVTGKVRKGDDLCPRGNTLPIISHRSGNLQSYALCNFERLSSINVRNNSVHLQGWRARASAHDLFHLFALSQRKINPLYWVRLWQIFNTPPQETEWREKGPVDALRNRYLLIFIRNINNKWNLTGTIVTESVRDNHNLDRHFHILQQTSSKVRKSFKFPTNELENESQVSWHKY